MNWTIGMTTVPSRIYDGMLLDTLRALRSSGFDDIHLFLDGPAECPIPDSTVRNPAIGQFGNWTLGLWELYAREPHADRYAIFEDDVRPVSNLRAYLDSLPFPADGHWNLWSFLGNESRLEGAPIGFQRSRQLYRGCLGLVFDLAGVLAVLSSRIMIDRPQDPSRGWRLADMALKDAMQACGRFEYVHNPSLLQHVGKVSTINKDMHAGRGDPMKRYEWRDGRVSKTFPGEGFDAMEWLK